MTSGYNLQGLIRKSTINSLTQFDRMGYYSQNMANWTTNGYKAVRFEEIMGENGYTKGVIRTDQSNGSIKTTKNPFDIAIDGPGLIPVTSKTGEIYYTRDGSMHMGEDGVLLTNNNDMIGSGIKIPADSVKIQIKGDGSIYNYTDLTKTPEYIGTIPLVTFQNPEGLKEVGGNRYEKTTLAGEEQLIVEHDRIKQCSLEGSNVDIFQHVNDIMRLNASLLASTTLMTAVDKMYEQAINIRES